MVMKTGFGVSIGAELLIVELVMVGVEVGVMADVEYEDDVDDDALLVLFVLELVGVGFEAG